jgi:D-3-phosphoglycerate dehydrogenase
MKPSVTRKILVTPRSFGKTDPAPYQMLVRAGFEVIINDTGGLLDDNQLCGLLKDCEGVILGIDPLTAKVIENAPKLRAVSKYGVGVDNIDLEACGKRGIRVSKTVGANSNAVADYTFALILAVARRVLLIDSRCRENDWSKITSIDVFGKTLGLIGLGSVGKNVVTRAKGFGMTVLAYDVFWDDVYASSVGIQRATLEQIYREADFISLHVPLNDQTRGMISIEQFEMMKPTAVLINTARGGLIDEGALFHALKSKQIYGAGIDVFDREPPNDKEWFSLENIIIGSHCAASTNGAVEQMGYMAVMNLVHDLEKE